MPILGVYFLLTPVRPETGSSLEYAYEILSAVSSSFQGEGRIARYSFIILKLSADIQSEDRIGIGISIGTEEMSTTPGTPIMMHGKRVVFVYLI